MYIIAHGTQKRSEDQAFALSRAQVPDGEVVVDVDAVDHHDLFRRHYPYNRSLDHERVSQHLQEEDPRNQHLPYYRSTVSRVKPIPEQYYSHSGEKQRDNFDRSLF
jgi:hypothetical protein